MFTAVPTAVAADPAAVESAMGAAGTDGDAAVTGAAAAELVDTVDSANPLVTAMVTLARIRGFNDARLGARWRPGVDLGMSELSPYAYGVSCRVRVEIYTRPGAQYRSNPDFTPRRFSRSAATRVGPPLLSDGS